MLALAACGINPSFDPSATSAADTTSSQPPPDPPTTTGTSSLPPTTTTDPAATSATTSPVEPSTTTGTTTPVDPTTSDTSTSETSTTDDTTTGITSSGCPNDPALIACYAFPDGKHDVLLDGSPNQLHGELEDIDLTASLEGYGDAAEFDDESRATVLYDKAFTSEHLTIAAFVRTAAKHRAVIDKHGQWALFVDDNQASCVVRGSGDAKTTAYAPIPPTEQWLHLACTYDGKDVRTHVHSESQPPVHNPAAHTAGIDQESESDLAIGRDHPEDGSHFLGDIDHVLVFSRALANEELCDLAGPLCPGP